MACTRPMRRASSGPQRSPVGTSRIAWPHPASPGNRTAAPPPAKRPACSRQVGSRVSADATRRSATRRQLRARVPGVALYDRHGRLPRRAARLQRVDRAGTGRACVSRLQTRGEGIDRAAAGDGLAVSEQHRSRQRRIGVGSASNPTYARANARYASGSMRRGQYRRLVQQTGHDDHRSGHGHHHDRPLRAVACRWRAQSGRMLTPSATLGPFCPVATNLRAERTARH
ncbi:hypothetical protein FOHLNKBM_3783 [Methylobacterium longum]|nr:hypothetical protein FOHLNKBM_3783 [Methylobacterium longum]